MQVGARLLTTVEAGAVAVSRRLLVGLAMLVTGCALVVQPDGADVWLAHDEFSGVSTGINVHFYIAAEEEE